MTALLWVPLALLVLAAGLAVAFWLLMRGQVENPSQLFVDGKPIRVRLRYGSKLPKALRASATTVGFVICFRDYPPGWPIQVAGRRSISIQLAAHECFHVVDRVRRGRWPYWRRILGDILRHPFDHDARPSEQEASAAAPGIYSGSMPGVDASFLLVPFR